MRIVVASPLYPPDIADPAPYVKEFAARLSRDGHDITVITYGHLPENVPGVAIMATDKRAPLLLRVARFTAALFRALKKADALYIQSGASAELPALIALALTPAKIDVLFRRSEEPPHKSFVRRLVRRLVLKRARIVETAKELVRPEIMPLEPYPARAFENYERAWREHGASFAGL